MIRSVATFLFTAQETPDKLSPGKAGAVSLVAIGVALAILAGLSAGQCLIGDEFIAQWSAVGMSVGALAFVLMGIYLFNLKECNRVEKHQYRNLVD